jgi:hypothetical protein
MLKSVLSIVISKVFKYKALLIGSALVFSLAFLYSSQSLNESTPKANSEESNLSQNNSPKAPSIPETPDLPDSETETPETPDSPENSSNVTTSIKIKINTETDGEDAKTSVDIDSDPPISTEGILDDIQNGNFNISLDTGSDGQFEIDFDSDFDQDTENESSFEQKIKEKRKVSN